MLRYMIRRLLFLVLVLIAVSLFTFIVFVKLPATDAAIRAAGRHPSPQLLREIRHHLGLDRPVWYQYWTFAKGLIPWPGLFLNRTVYFSWLNQVAVRDEIFARLPVTATLTAGAAILWLLIGIPIGIISAIRPGTVFDRAGMLFALVGVSAPIFWLSLVLLYLFHFTWHLAPSSGIPIGRFDFASDWTFAITLRANEIHTIPTAKTTSAPTAIRTQYLCIDTSLSPVPAPLASRFKQKRDFGPDCFTSGGAVLDLTRASRRPVPSGDHRSQRRPRRGLRRVARAGRRRPLSPHLIREHRLQRSCGRSRADARCRRARHPPLGGRGRAPRLP